MFGELSLFGGGARTASAVAREPSTLLVLDRQDLLSFLRKHPDAALDLLTTMGQRIRNADEMLRRRVARNINEEIEIRSTTVITHLHEKVDFLTEEVLARLPRAERR